MSAGTRTFNYTRRLKIRREHAGITAREGADSEPATFDARIDLSGYALPAEARVFVEAYRSPAFQRFDFGTVGACAQPDDRRLAEFGSLAGVLFRVKVVEAPGGAAGPAAKLLAQADQLKPDQAGKRRSLLDVDFADFRDEVWRVDLDEDDPNTPPVLLISRHLSVDRSALVRSPEFVSTALPQTLRTILRAALRDGAPDPEDDASRWPGRWVGLACGLLGVSEPPDNLEDPDHREEWIDRVVEAFGRQRKVAGAFGQWWNQKGRV